MKAEIICTTEDRQAWLSARRCGLGGSDAAAILGLSRFSTPTDVYLDKRGESKPKDETPWLRWGNILEPAIRQEYADQTGRTVRDGGLMRHPVHCFMLGSTDGLTDCRRVYEGKNRRTSQGWGEPGSDEVPRTCLLQVQQYMAVTGFPVADVAVLFGGSDFQIYEVPADTEIQEMLIEAEAEFWQRIVDGNPPNPVTFEEAQTRWGSFSQAKEITASDGILRAVNDLRGTKASMKELKGREDELKATISTAMGDADTLVDLDGTRLVTWKLAKAPTRFDKTSFSAAHPELCKEFTIQGKASRRFLVKAVK